MSQENNTPEPTVAELMKLVETLQLQVKHSIENGQRRQVVKMDSIADKTKVCKQMVKHLGGTIEGLDNLWWQHCQRITRATGAFTYKTALRERYFAAKSATKKLDTEWYTADTYKDSLNDCLEFIEENGGIITETGYHFLEGE